MHFLAWHIEIDQTWIMHMRDLNFPYRLPHIKSGPLGQQACRSYPRDSPCPSFSTPYFFSFNLHPLPSSTSTVFFSSRCLCGYHRESEGSTLTFDVAQNWISSVILPLSPLWSVIHAVTNWVACQQPECVNGWLLVKCVLLYFFLTSDGLWVHYTERGEGTHTHTNTHAHTHTYWRVLAVQDSPIQRHILSFVNVISGCCLLNVTLHALLSGRLWHS